MRYRVEVGVWLSVALLARGRRMWLDKRRFGGRTPVHHSTRMLYSYIVLHPLLRVSTSRLY